MKIVKLSRSGWYKISNKYDQRGTVERIKGSGRQLIPNSVNLVHIQEFIRKNNKLAAKKIVDKIKVNGNKKVSRRTLNIKLKNLGYSSCKPAFKLFLTARHKKYVLRLQKGRQHGQNKFYNLFSVMNADLRSADMMEAK